MNARDSCSCFFVISQNWCIFRSRRVVSRDNRRSAYLFRGWKKKGRMGKVKKGRKTRKSKEAGTNNNYIRRLRKKKSVREFVLHLTRETLCIWLKATRSSTNGSLYNEGVAKYFFFRFMHRAFLQNRFTEWDKNLCLGLCCLSIQSLFLSSSF